MTERPATTQDELLAIVDGTLTRAADAVIPARDLGVIRGDGIFEVFQLYGGQPFALDEHLERLERSADAVALSLSVEQIRGDVVRLLEAIPAVDGNVRIIVTRSGTRLVLQEPPLPELRGVRLTLVPHLVTPLMAGVKSTSYAFNCHARRIAESLGCDDALLVSAADGQILEGPFTSFAWVEAGRLFTPPLSAGILDSITRRVLLAATDAQERPCIRESLERAEAACIMGTGLEIVPVSEILEVRTFPEEAPSIRAAAEAVAASIRSRLAGERSPKEGLR